MRVTVSGRTLAAAPLAQVRGPRLLIPVVPVAVELGYAINIDNLTETVQVRRGGVDATFVKQTAELRENGAIIAVLPGMADINFPPNKTDLLLPIEVVAPLLAVSVTIDREQGIVRIEPESAGSSATSDTAGQMVNVQRADYTYGVNLVAGQMSQNLNLSSSGLIGDTKYFVNSNLTGGAGGPFVFLRGGNVTLLRPKGQRIQAGDFAIGTDLLLTSTGLRGAEYDQQVNDKMKVAFYGGKAISGVDVLSGSFARPRYDLKMFGGQLTYSPDQATPGTVSDHHMVWTIGSNVFTGAGQNGQVVDTSFRYNTRLNQLDAEAAVGDFHGTTTDNRIVDGFGTAITVGDTFTPWRALTLQGRYGRFSPNFVTPQRTGQYNNLQSVSFGGSYRVNARLTFGGFASRGDSLTGTGHQTNSYNFNASYDPSERYLPRVTVTHTSMTNPFGNFTVTQVNLSRDFSRWRPFLNYTLARGTNQKANAVTFGSSFMTQRFGTFQAVQSVGGGKTGSFDWYPTRPLIGGIQISAGAGYSAINGNTTPLARVMTTMRLPGRQTLQVSYTRTQTNSETRWSMMGPLDFWRKNSDASRSASPTIITDSTIQGRIFQDVNQDNQYDDRVDVPMKGLTVVLDNTNTAVTDPQGHYRFDRVSPGIHTLSISLYDVRADLIPASSPQQTVMLSPRRIVTSDFRLVKSGRVSGRIWRDTNGNGQYDEGELALANIRIVSSSGRDTYTDIDGTFLLSDLPAGEQIIFLDQRTIPADLLATATQLPAQVKPGQETTGVNFVFKPRSRSVEEKQFPGKQSSQLPKS